MSGNKIVLKRLSIYDAVMMIIVIPILLFIPAVSLSQTVDSGTEAAFSVTKDDFNDNKINSSMWKTYTEGSGPTVAERNKRLEITFPANSSGDTFGAGYISVCTISGDFDIQVDYSLLTWPKENGVRVGIGLSSYAANVERISLGNRSYDFPDQSSREAYVTDFSGYVQFVPTGDKSGKLRLVRSGSEITGYYRKSSGWAKISSSTVSTGDVIFGITVWSHDYAFTDKQVKIAFDNFIINKGELTCPTPTPSATLTPTSTATHTPVPTATTTTVTPTPPPSDYLKYTKGASRKYGEKIKIGDPISASNGAYEFTMPLLSLGGPMDLRFELFYRSDFDQNLSDARVPDPFWWYPYTTASVGEIVTVDGVDKTLATVQLPSGDLVSFKKDSSGNWTLVDPDEDVGFAQYYNNGSSIKYVLKETTEYVYLMDPAQEMMYIFQKLPAVSSTAARIVRIMDRNDNTVTYSYSTETDQNPSRIEDGLGRSFDLTYGDVGGETFLQTVTDHGGRKIQFTYEVQGTDNASLPTLRSVTDAMNHVTTFRYAGSSSEHHIISKELPRGNTPFTQTYESVTLNGDTGMRVVSQKDAQDNTTTLAYDSNANVVTETQPDSNTRKYKHFSQYSLPEKLIDTANNEAKMEKNSSEQLTSVTDRLGDTTSFTYHDETGKLSSITNAKGDKFTYTYTAQSQTVTNPINSEQVDFTFYNLTRTDYPDNTSEQFTYDADGNAITRIDQAGKTWTSTYNARGQLLTITNPEGGVTTYTYNTDATLASITDSDTGVTTYTYDTLMRPTTITRPDATSIQIAYNANDQITSMTDEKGNVTTFTYDVNDNLAGITDPADKEMQFTYDDMDRLTKTTDRLGKVTTQTYDALGRLSSVADPTAVKTTFGYDVRGWVNQMTRGGNTWQKGYDDEGMVSSGTTPLGFVRTLQRDNLGYLTGITDPLGNTTTLTRDAMSRTTSVTDPLGRTTSFTYDGLGLLTGVNMPVIGTTTYQRNGIGVLTGMTDLNGQNWTFTTSPMGRLTAEIDPLGNTLQYTYDTQGRPSLATFPDGGTMTSAYDASNNLTRQLFSDGTDLQFTYDSLDRLTTANNIALTYNAEGNVTNTEDTGISFGAAYDDAGRLKTVTYNSGTFTVTYTYEGTTGLLTNVTDSFTGTQVSFTYDSDFRPVTITRSSGVNTTLTWDNAGRLTRIQDGTFIDLQYTIDTAWQVTKLNMTAPLNPFDFLSNSASNFTYDAASQVSTSGYTYDKRGRLIASPDHTFSWDGASRLVGIDDVILTYNGLGDLITRTQEDSAIHFYYNHAISLSPIVAEQDEDTGKFLRFYVWTPDGQLLYMIDAANGNKVYFYHFARTGSTLGLTDATGTVTDSYAYDPYGRLLSHQGSSAQPFTFIGRWGVRQEGENGKLYHMRARYYDAVTARFLIRDPVWPRITDPKQINPYQYAFNNPLQYVDLTGTSLTKQEQMELNELLGMIAIDAVTMLRDQERDMQGRNQRLQEESERRNQENLVLRYAEDVVYWAERVVDTLESGERVFGFDRQKEKAEAQANLNINRERLEQLKRQFEEGREKFDKAIRGELAERAERSNRIKAAGERVKELQLKKVGGKEAFIGKRRMLIKVLKFLNKAQFGPLKELAERASGSLFEEVGLIFFEFAPEDLEEVLQNDIEAGEIIFRLKMAQALLGLE